MFLGVTGSSVVVLLAVLACPVGMGLMMLFMGRGMMGAMKRNDRQGADVDNSSLAEMKAEQARLAEKIETLEGRPRRQATAEPPTDREPDPVS